MTAQEETKINLPAAIKAAIRFSGCSQYEIARRMGLNNTVFNLKLHEKRGGFTVPEIKALLLTLAEVQGINKRDEIPFFLRLSGLRESTFSAADWQKFPLCELD